MSVSINVPSYDTAVERGVVMEKSGYHQPGSNGHHLPSCGCELTTRKGAYRDVTVGFNDVEKVHFYHQSPVVVQDGRFYRLSSCGWQTPTTKERINRYVPDGYKVIQRDFEWYVETPDGDMIDFEDGMVIES